eukprot:m.9987 g.9987  ORF g.9987 m.9987 type:complete len:238 (+) comp4257_c0_seq1:1677-2390(+)
MQTMAGKQREALSCQSFALSFRVKFDNFDTNYPMLVTTENGALVCHGLGPAYGSDRGRIGVYLYTKSGVGPHGRGIQGTPAGRSHNEGWVRSSPVAAGVWHTVRVAKTRRTLSLSVGGETMTETIQDGIRDEQFDMKDPGYTLVGSGTKRDLELQGEITDFVIEGGSAPPQYSRVAGAPAMTLLEQAQFLQKQLNLKEAPLQQTATAAAALIGLDVSECSLRDQYDRLMTAIAGCPG